MAGGVTVEVKRVSRLFDRMANPTRILQSQKTVVQKATDAAKARAKARAPGSLGRHITSKLTTRGRTVEGIVSQGTVTNRGFRYPWALEASKKIRYRYRQGVRLGKLTYHWFTGAKSGIKGRMRFDLKAEAAGMRVWWRS